jgi:undecaprenyl-diphosphatase
MPKDRFEGIRGKLPWLSRVDSRLLLVFLVFAPSIALFIQIAAEVIEGDTLDLDRWIMRSLRSSQDSAVPIGGASVSEAMVEITVLGGTTVLTLVTMLAAFYLVARRKFALAMFLAAAIGAGSALNAVLKNLFLRDRPDLVPHLVEVTSASFPSGHAMNSAMVYLTLAALLVSVERSWRVRVYIMSAALFLVIAIGTSRVYLGVHWPSDVLAGWSAGAAWAVLCALVVHRLQREKKLEGAESAMEQEGNEPSTTREPDTSAPPINGS